MLKMNLERLRDLLCQAPAEETVASDGVNGYLLDHVIKPLLREETVKYGDLDYSRFEEDDIRDAAAYCEKIETAAYHMQHLIGSFASLSPSVCGTATFC